MKWWFAGRLEIRREEVRGARKALAARLEKRGDRGKKGGGDNARDRACVGDV